MKSVLTIRVIGSDEYARFVTNWRMRTLATAQGEERVVSPPELPPSCRSFRGRSCGIPTAQTLLDPSDASQANVQLFVFESGPLSALSLIRTRP